MNFVPPKESAVKPMQLRTPEEQDLLKTLDEQDLWKSVVVAMCSSSNVRDFALAVQWADSAVKFYRERVPKRAEMGPYRSEVEGP